MTLKRVSKVEVCGSHSLRLAFDDGPAKRVDVVRLLQGAVLEPLLDAAYFARALLDPVAGTVVWPNGADSAPGARYDWPPEDRPLRKQSRKRVRRKDKTARR